MKSAKLEIILAACLLFLFIPGAANGQSGRRVPNKPLPTAAQTPVPEPTPEPVPKTEMKPAYSVTVVSNSSMSMSSAFIYPDRMSQWVIERLSYSTLLEVGSGGVSNRKKASESAKNSDGYYVLLVELAEDPFNTPGLGRTQIAQGSVWINYYLFTPTTGKLKSSGRSELRPELLRGSIGNRNSRRFCNSTLPNNDYLLLEASFEVAERVMNGFNLPIPPIKCGRSLFYSSTAGYLSNIGRSGIAP